MKKLKTLLALLLIPSLLWAAEPKADKIRIDDAGSYYASTTVENALQELFSGTILSGIYWKSDGSSTCTGNWNLGSYSLSAGTLYATDTGASIFGTTLTLDSGSITDTTGAIDFGNENLSTTGTLGAGAISGTSVTSSGGFIDSRVTNDADLPIITAGNATNDGLFWLDPSAPVANTLYLKLGGTSYLRLSGPATALTADVPFAIGGGTGVKLTGLNGALTILSQKAAGNLEDLKLDLENTSNKAVFSSSTGVTTLDFSALNLNTTGTLGAGAITGTSLNLKADSSQIVLDSDGTYTTTITDSTATSSKVLTLPNFTGTLAYSILGTYAGIDTYINQSVKSTATPAFVGVTGNNAADFTLDAGAYDLVLSGSGIVADADIDMNSNSISNATNITATGAGTFDNLTLTAGQDWKTFSRASVTLALQGQSSGLSSILEVFSKDGDGTDTVNLNLFKKGSPESYTNSEYLQLATTSAAGLMTLRTIATGTGTVNALNIYTGTNTNQLYLDTSGGVGVGQIPTGNYLEVGKVSVFNEDVLLSNNYIGFNGYDMSLYHDGTDGHILMGDGMLLIGGNTRLGGASDYANLATNGDISFAGTAGFYPRVLNQTAEPAAGTGATQLDTGEMCIWTDSDDSKCYLAYNHSGTIKTVELP